MEPKITVAPPGPKAMAIIDRDARLASPSYIHEYPLVVERGEGPWIYDVDGNRYLDLMAGIAVAATGHSHPKVVKAIQDSAAKFLHICGTDFHYETKSGLFEALDRYVPKMGKKRIFLSNTGAEAIEGALKAARHHTKRFNVIAFKGAFHGRTYASISMNASKSNYRAFFGPLLPGVYHAAYAHPACCGHSVITEKPEACREECNCVATNIEKELFTAFVDPKEVAAIFIEPILGEGGYVMPPKKFLQDLRALCDRHGILLVFDEVQCGAGRTGHMYASEYFDVAPDIYCTAKGLGSGMPIAAIVGKESVMTWPRGSHGSTYGGNPVACAAAIATLEIVEGLLPQVRKTGEFLMQGLRELGKRHKVLADVRGAGLMIGAEFLKPGTKEPAGQYVSDLEQLAFRRGLLLLSCGKSTIRFAPPLVVTEGDMKVALRVLDECMTELAPQHGF
jgi:4-aminobutyrate aminotransferase